MNKFAAFAVLAVAALAVSVSTQPIDDEDMTQAFLATSNEDEYGALKAKNLEVFNDFCITSRDYIQTAIKDKTNGATSKVFQMFFSSAAEIANEGINVQQEATEKLAAQLANPDTPIEGGDSEVDKIIANGQAKIQGESQPRSIITAFKSAVSAISAKVGGIVNERIEYLYSFAKPSQVLTLLSKGCEQIHAYENDLKDQLKEYKQGMAEEYQSVELGAIPCATASKIVRSDGMCDLIRVAAPRMKKMVGLQ